MLILFLALAWVPVTMHCNLESIPGLEFLQCSTDAPANSDCQGDGCDVVESGLYKVEDDGPLVSPAAFVLLAVLAATASTDSVSTQVSHSFLTVAPPELPKCWQFVFRTASPPRAPSFAS